jgi:hypothetical protein
MLPPLPALPPLPTELSALTKLADKNVVVGFFLPALLFTIFGMALFYDKPLITEFLRPTLEVGDVGRLIYLMLIVSLLSILMWMLNDIQYKILQGYQWPISDLKWFQDRQRRRFEIRDQRFKALNAEWIAAGEHFDVSKITELGHLRTTLVTEFPMDLRFLLPTRFGNAIRAFETYSTEVYGADGVALWLHVTTVLPKELQLAIADARARVDCLVNISCFAAVIAIAAASRFVMNAATVHAPWIDFGKIAAPASFYFILFAFAGVLVSRICYRWSIKRILHWGNLVKAGFDCSLPALAKELGYELTDTEEDQRRFWRDVSERAIYHHPLRGNWTRISNKDQQT